MKNLLQKYGFTFVFGRFQRFFTSKTAGFPCYVDVDLSVKNRYFFEPQNVDLSGCRLKCEKYGNFEFRKHSSKTRFSFVSEDFTIIFRSTFSRMEIFAALRAPKITHGNLHINNSFSEFLGFFKTYILC